jgi:D-serine deaminase-like pyridoxal phosphate-dependent protein
VAALAAAVGDPDQLAVLVEVDSGQHRSGVHPDAAGDVAGAARRAGLRVVGVFTHGGHAYNPAASDPTGDEERALVAAARSVERATGADVAVLSAGATPTTARRQHVGAITEERPGTYVFGDAQQLALGAIGPDGVALTVTTTVVAVHDGGRRVIVDAGSKVLGEAVTPNTASRGLVAGRPDGAVVALSEHHGTLQVPGGGIRVGDRLALVPNHACITVNLVDDLVAVHGDGTTERWPVAGRGKNT